MSSVVLLSSTDALIYLIWFIFLVFQPANEFNKTFIWAVCRRHETAWKLPWRYVEWFSCLCPGPYGVRLVGGENHCEGTLEGKYNGELKPLSDAWRFLTQQHIADACRQVGCADVISYSTKYLRKQVPMWELSTRCERTGSSLCMDWRNGASSRVITVNCSGNFSILCC